MLTLGLVALGLTGGLTACTRNKAPATDRKLTIVASGDIHGVVEPCGCTSDVLGDVARIRTLAKDGLWVDAGNLLYDPETYKGERKFQAEVKARCIAGVLAPAEIGAGPSDLVGPLPDGLRLHAANVTAPWAKAPTVRVVNGVRVGVVGLLAPQPLPGGLTPSDPKPVLTRAVQQLRDAKADVIVALLAMPRPEARALIATVPGVDFAFLSIEPGEGMREPELVTSGEHTAYLIAPAEEGKRVAKLELTLRSGKLQLFADDAGRKARRERIAPRVDKQRARLAELKADAKADPEFVQTSENELRDLEAKLAELDRAAAPPPGSYFTYALVPVRRSIAREPAALALIKTSDEQIGKANLERSKLEPPPPAEPGKASYVGDESCKSCHATQYEFWTKSHHALAWKSLVDVGKQYDYDCIGCHVTGWQKPGGVHLASVEARALTNVQCEVCHGPGGAHIKAELPQRKSTIVNSPDQNLCGSTCHIPEHSDTFERTAYLRDVLGPGHGEAARKALGPGPTAHELRAAAIAKAKAATN